MLLFFAIDYIDGYIGLADGEEQQRRLYPVPHPEYEKESMHT